MPNHVHLLVWPTRKKYSISRILTSIKRPVTLRAINYLRANSPLFLKRMEYRRPDGTTAYRFWQRGGGYDRNMTQPKSILAAIDYIHANPVRKGLCQRSTDWPWSSATEHNSPGQGKLPLDLHSLAGLS